MYVRRFARIGEQALHSRRALVPRVETWRRGIEVVLETTLGQICEPAWADVCTLSDGQPSTRCNFNFEATKAYWSMQSRNTSKDHEEGFTA